MKAKALPMKAVKGAPGVSRRGGKYVTTAYFKGESAYVGTFEKLEVAKRARAAKLAEMERLHKAGRATTSDTTVTFEIFALGYLKRRGTQGRTKQLAASSHRALTTHLTAHLIPAFGAYRIADLTHAVVDDLFADVAVDHSPKYRRNVFMSLRAVLRDAYLRNVITFDPTKDLTAPEVDTHQVEIPPPEKVADVIDAMRSPWRDAALLAANTGLREGELLALEWSDLDVSRGVIRVTKTRDQTGVIKKRGKTKNSTREVPIDAEAMRALLAYREHMRAERNRAIADAQKILSLEYARRAYSRRKEPKKVKKPVRCPGRTRGESVRAYKARRVLEGLQSPHWDIYMFPAAVARDRRENRLPVIEARNLLRELHRAADAVGIRLRFHDLRHVFASLVLHAGGQGTLHFLRNALGHAKASTTLDIYGHWLPSDPAVHLAPVTALFHRAGPPHNPPHSEREKGAAEPPVDSIKELATDGESVRS